MLIIGCLLPAISGFLITANQPTNQERRPRASQHHTSNEALFAEVVFPHPPDVSQNHYFANFIHVTIFRTTIFRMKMQDVTINNNIQKILSITSFFAILNIFKSTIYIRVIISCERVILHTSERVYSFGERVILNASVNFFCRLAATGNTLPLLIMAHHLRVDMRRSSVTCCMFTSTSRLR